MKPASDAPGTRVCWGGNGVVTGALGIGAGAGV